MLLLWLHYCITPATYQTELAMLTCHRLLRKVKCSSAPDTCPRSLACLCCALDPHMQPGYENKKYVTTIAKLDKVIAISVCTDIDMSFVLSSRMRPQKSSHHKG